MISTTGRRPVIAAPTPIPVNPGSEIGVSITRSLPNSSTNPDNTLKGVPASATSSPIMHTRGSRRISSASASRIASPKVSSRTLVWVAVSGIDVRLRRIRELLLHEPISQNLDGIALGGPSLLFLLGAIVFAIDIAHVVPAIAVSVAQQKCRACARPRALDKSRCRRMHRADVLPVYAFRRQTKSPRTSQNVAGGRLRVVRIFVVHIVLADVNHWQFPELRHVHDFVEDSLPQRALAKKADTNSAIPELLGRKCRAGGDTRAAADDRVGPKISCSRIGNVHRSAFAPAVAGLFAE